jgi:hypothetical protein
MSLPIPATNNFNVMMFSLGLVMLVFSIGFYYTKAEELNKLNIEVFRESERVESKLAEQSIMREGIINLLSYIKNQKLPESCNHSTKLAHALKGKKSGDLDNFTLSIQTCFDDITSLSKNLKKQEVLFESIKNNIELAEGHISKFDKDSSKLRDEITSLQIKTDNLDSMDSNIKSLRFILAILIVISLILIGIFGMKWLRVQKVLDNREINRSS